MKPFNFDQKSKRNNIFKLFKSVEFVYVFGCLSSLVIPWFLPVSPSNSDSYYYGFSNLAGLIILSVTISVCFLMLYKNSDALLIKHVDTNEYFSYSGNKEFKLRFKSFYILAGFVFIIFLYLLNRTGRTISYGESAYFIQRLYLMQDGLIPYIDFEFAYGSGLLYFPFCLITFLKVGVPTAYQISFFVEALIGYYSLWYLCKKVSIPEFNNKIFFLLFVPAYILLFMGGANCTLFRFAVPLVLVIWAFQKISTDPTVLKNILYPVGVFCLIFVISPEIAITCTLALFGCFVFANSVSFKNILMLIPGIAILVAASIFVKFINNSFITLYIFSQGGNNFPWFVSPTILAFLFLIYFSLVVVLGNKKAAFGTPQILILVISILNLPGAMGRCDAGHLFFYGFGFFLVSLSAAPYILANKLRMLISASNIVIFIIIVMGTIYLFKPYWVGYAKHILGNYNISVGLNNNSVVDQKDIIQIDSLIMHSDGKPLAVASIPAFFENALLRKQIDFPYFINGMNKMSIYSNEVLIKEFLKHNTILVPQKKDWLCGFYPYDKTTMFFLFGMAPFIRHKNNTEFINEKLCSVLESYFVIDGSLHVKGFNVYKKKQGFDE
jgi:hypothetical protein